MGPRANGDSLLLHRWKRLTKGVASIHVGDSDIDLSDVREEERGRRRTDLVFERPGCGPKSSIGLSAQTGLLYGVRMMTRRI